MNELLVIVLCLAINAILAAVEMAFVTVTKASLRELARKGNTQAKRIIMLRENPERTLSVIQVGITAVGAIAAAVGGAGAAEAWSPWLHENWGLSERSAEAVSVVAIVLPYTYLSVVVGELVPKTLALRHSLSIVLRSGPYLLMFDRILSPVVTLLEASTRGILNLLRPWRTKTTNEAAEGAGESVELDQLSKQAREYVLNLVDLEKKRIRDVRLPWLEAVYVTVEQTAMEVERVVLDSGHTRLPVLDGDEVKGIINTKEFIVYNATGGTDWRTVIRPVVKVEESSPILRALRRMQESRSHLSITYVNGVRSGIVTVEDIFEEVIGELYDEDDDGRLRRVLAMSPRRRLGSHRAPYPWQ